MDSQRDARVFQKQSIQIQRALIQNTSNEDTEVETFHQLHSGNTVNILKPTVETLERRFIERHHLEHQDRFEYKRQGTEPGFVFIFNHETFKESAVGTRYGTKRDVNEIVRIMQDLGYNIDKNHIMDNGTTEKIDNKLSEISAMDHTQNNCLIIFFLSHGDKNDFLYTHDGIIPASAIWMKFVNCPTLNGKPKAFIFQACKGEGFTSSIDRSEPSPLTPKYLAKSAMGPDMVIVYSQVEEKWSYRDKLTGSWFIQELCKTFRKYGNKDHFLTLLTRTAKSTSMNYYHIDKNSTGTIEKQMPVFISTLRRKFYLNRNKDRNFTLELVNRFVEVSSRLEASS